MTRGIVEQEDGSLIAEDGSEAHQESCHVIVLDTSLVDLEVDDADVRRDGYDERHVLAALGADDAVYPLADGCTPIRPPRVQIEACLVYINPPLVDVAVQDPLRYLRK